MNKKYHPLFQIDLRHDFFADKKVDGLSLTPTPYTAQQMRRHDLRIRREQSGISVYFGQEQGLPSWASQMNEFLVLTFQVGQTNPRFINYSRLPFVDPRKKKYFFSNKDLLGKEEQPLSREEKVGPSDTYEVFPSLFLQKFEGVKPGAEVRIENTFGESPLIAELQPSEEGIATLQVDLRSHHVGKYSMHLDNDPVSNFLVFSADSRDNAVSFGCINVLVGQAPDGKVYLVDLAEEEYAQYYIHFGARSTTWRYFIFDHHEVAYEDLRIEGGTAVKFESPEEVVMRDGQKALSFESAEPLPLQEESGLDLQLKAVFPGNNGNGQSSSRTIKLPVPSAEVVKPVLDEGGEQIVYSDMYVYL